MTSTSALPAQKRYLPWVVWGAGLFVYVLAVANRSSFGVAGILAATRFDVNATVLSLFVVVQLAVYAGMQLPAGMALDKWGPRRLLVMGAIAMSIGQLAMALVPTVTLAIAARVLIGAGDATIFVSAIRLVWDWFPRQKVPLLTQLTGLAGQGGQIISALPFALALHHLGWAPSFIGLSVAGVIAATVAAIFVKRRGPGSITSVLRDDAETHTSPHSPPVPPDSSFMAAMRHPATWLGFFTHMLCGMGTTVFVLMWGVPFMVEGERYSDNVVSTLLLVIVATSIIAAPLIGRYTARNPNRRSTAALFFGGLAAIGWLIMIIPTHPLPVWAFTLAVIFISAGGPASLIGLDLAGSFNSPIRRSTVQGIANMGGFVAAISVMLTIGHILDEHTRGPIPVLTDFRAALATILIPMGVAAIGLYYFRIKTRRRLGIPSTNAF